LPALAKGQVESSDIVRKKGNFVNLYGLTKFIKKNIAHLNIIYKFAVQNIGNTKTV